MDPLSAIFVMTVLGGLFVKGVDVATDGLLSAEVGAGVRGAGAYTVRDVRDHWGRASEKAREIRSRSRSGRAVQGILDDAGAVARTGGAIGRVLFGEASRFGSGVRSGWQTARDQARSDRTERRGDAPWPNENPNTCARCGRTERDDEVFGRYYQAGIRLCDECVAWLDRRYPNGWPNNPGRVTNFGKGWSRPEAMPDPNQAPFGGPAVVHPLEGCLRTVAWVIEDGKQMPRYCGEPCEFGELACPKHLARDADRNARRLNENLNGEPEREADHLGPLPPKCPDCGMPLVISSLNDHRMGQDRCHYADMDDDDADEPLGPEADADRGPLPGTPECANCGRPLTYNLQRARWYGVPVLGDPDAMWCPDCARNAPADNPNGDPNMPLPSTVPDANGDVKCGCCAQLHKPLPPGEHCPNCHIHDHAPTTPSQPNAPTTRGPSMADINSAPAAIAAWEAFGSRWESLQSRADTIQGEIDSLKNETHALYDEIGTAADGMGDFAIGGEVDTAAAAGDMTIDASMAKEQTDNLVGSISTAKEAVNSYIAGLHAEYDASIEAAAGKAADAHSVMQEA